MKIEVKNLDFGYSSEKLTLHDINLTIDRPGLYCIIGPNGVGKSTLVRCMNKIYHIPDGTVFVNGVDLNEISIKENAKNMSYVPVGGDDVFSLPVVDTILVGRHTQQHWRTTAEDMEITYKAMRLLGIEDLAMHSYNQLSAGQHQKVAIARGLVQETEMLILDEPTANLDVRYQVYVTELLKELARRNDMIILMISHDLNITARYADEVIVMAYPGVIHSIGKPEDVITEKTIKEVYGLDSDMIVHKMCKPHIILGSAVRID
ncbi:MAG: ABC transporter ATP-binding protein [archaeon]|nr:ABC transporter ATP-binding protein [archaeon]